MIDRAAMLFSGGVDSTYTAARVAPECRRLVLLTWRVPGMINVERSQRSSRQLQRLFGDRVVHEVRDIRPFVTALRGGALHCVAENFRHGFYYSWCLGCKAGMHLQTIAYCRAQGISLVFDGANAYDRHALEQRRDVVDRWEALYRENGLELRSPFYEEDIGDPPQGRLPDLLRKLTLLKDSTAARVAYCAKLGIDFGPGLGSQYRTTQPSCLASPLFNSARVALGTLAPENTEGIQRYVTETLARGRELLGLAESAAPR